MSNSTIAAAGRFLRDQFIAAPEQPSLTPAEVLRLHNEDMRGIDNDLRAASRDMLGLLDRVEALEASFHGVHADLRAVSRDMLELLDRVEALETSFHTISQVTVTAMNTPRGLAS